MPGIFHDIDLAAFRPTIFRYVVAEHPERRPNALTFRDLDARFESAIRLGEKILSLESRGSVVASDAIRASEFFLLSGDNQIAVLDFHVLRARSVSLELLIAPALAAQVVRPLCRIGSGAIGRREFIGPSERPIRRRRNEGTGSCAATETGGREKQNRRHDKRANLHGYVVSFARVTVFTRCSG